MRMRNDLHLCDCEEETRREERAGIGKGSRAGGIEGRWRSLGHRYVIDTPLNEEI